MNCDGCGGACCRFMCFPFVRTNPDTQKWLEMHGVKRIGPALFMFPFPCLKLDVASGKCTDYTNRPQMCRNAPVGDTRCELARKIYKEYLQQERA